MLGSGLGLGLADSPGRDLLELANFEVTCHEAVIRVSIDLLVMGAESSEARCLLQERVHKHPEIKHSCLPTFSTRVYIGLLGDSTGYADSDIFMTISLVPSKDEINPDTSNLVMQSTRKCLAQNHHHSLPYHIHFFRYPSSVACDHSCFPFACMITPRCDREVHATCS